MNDDNINTEAIFSFNEFNLEYNEILIAIVIYFVILIFIGFYAVLSYNNNIKKMSWVVSMFNSGIMTAIGIIYIFNKLTYSKLTSFNNDRDIYHGIDNISYLICLWFAMVNAFDLVLGIIFYSKYLDPLTAYIHHPLFIWIMSLASRGNGWIFSCEVFGPGFCYMLIEELPTFLLALGYVHNNLRTDIGFGITFFLFRILYHIYMFILAYYSNVDRIVLFLYLLTTILHIYWFTNWYSKYGYKLLQTKKSNKD